MISTENDFFFGCKENQTMRKLNYNFICPCIFIICLGGVSIYAIIYGTDLPRHKYCTDCYILERTDFNYTTNLTIRADNEEHNVSYPCISATCIGENIFSNPYVCSINTFVNIQYTSDCSETNTDPKHTAIFSIGMVGIIATAYLVVMIILTYKENGLFEKENLYIANSIRTVSYTGQYRIEV